MSAGPLLTLWLAFAAVSEVLLRRTSAEWLDLPLVGFLTILAFLTYESLTSGRLRIPDRIGGLWKRTTEEARRLLIEVGIDLRLEPPLPVGFPRPVLMAGGLLAVGLMAVLIWAPAFPMGVRALLTRWSGTVHVVYIGALWTGLLGLSLIIGVFVWIHLHDRVLNGSAAAEVPVRTRLVLAAAPLAVALGAALALPARVPAALVLGVGALGVALAFGQRREDLWVLWRSRGGGAPVRSLSLRWWVAGHTVLTTLLLLLGLTLAAGAEVVGAESGALITPFLGKLMAWMGALGGVTWLWVGPARLLKLARTVPGEAPPLAAIWRPGGGPGHREPNPPAELVRDLASRGIRLSRPGSRRTSVRPRLAWTGSRRNSERPPLASGGTKVTSRGNRLPDAGNRRQAGPALEIRLDPSRPDDKVVWEPVRDGIQSCVVRPEALMLPGVLATLRRADRALQRRELLTGLERLHDLAAAREFRKGSGFWIAPHLWYISAMTRDTNEEDSVTVGPPYEEVLSPTARRHAFEVFRALQVDLIFFEDGLPFSALERVLIRMFERVDVWGVEPLLERHVDGIPGVRILLHAFDLESPLDREHYPEPDYEQIGRARILHIMKDRGGPEEPVEAPVVPDLIPEWIGG